MSCSEKRKVPVGTVVGAYPASADPRQAALMTQAVTTTDRPAPGVLVFTAEPAFFPCINFGWMQGMFTAAPNIVRKVHYINLPIPSNVADGVEELNDMINDNPGKRIQYFAHSEGSQLAYAWNRKYGATSGADPRLLSFFLTGNPERKYGGSTRVPTKPQGYGTAIYGGPGLINDASRYRIMDFARQYDFFADYPSAVNPNDKAIENAYAGMNFHMNYFRIHPFSSENHYYTEGNVTYVWQRSPWTPLAMDQKPQDRELFDRKIRPWVEAGYNRPVQNMG